MNLNVDNWGTFAVGDIFNIVNGKGITKEEIENNPGELIAVQGGEENNGYFGRIDKEYCQSMNYVIWDVPCLTVARTGSAGFVSYQKDGCVVGDSAKVLDLKDKTHATDFVFIFLRTILSMLRFKYNYGRKVTEDKYSSEMIKLPITEKGEPDWVFMEKYIKSLRYKPLTTKNEKCGILNLGHDKWGSFNLDDIFEITKAFAYNKETFEEDSEAIDKINCITRTAMNNGCAYKGEKTNDLKIETGNALTIGGEGVVCFYQEKEFVCGTNMTVLRNDKLNKYTGLFLCGTINHYSDGRFSYGRAFNMFQVKKTVIKLPVNSIGEPDWEFMEEYIKSLPYGDKL